MRSGPLALAEVWGQSRQPSFPHPSRPADACVLFFSSGSTGKPKGILSTHRVVAIQCWRWRRIPIDETLDGDGFLRTGDGGFMDDKGRLVWEGRLNDIIKTGGANVSPVEVDAVLAADRTRRLASLSSPAWCRSRRRSRTGMALQQIGELRVPRCISPEHDDSGGDGNAAATRPSMAA